MRDDEQRLEEFGRLELGEADAEPAPRAVHLAADDRHQEEQDGEDDRADDREPPRRSACGSIETPIITGTATAIQISWR